MSNIRPGAHNRPSKDFKAIPTKKDSQPPPLSFTLHQGNYVMHSYTTEIPVLFYSGSTIEAISCC